MSFLRYALYTCMSFMYLFFYYVAFILYAYIYNNVLFLYRILFCIIFTLYFILLIYFSTIYVFAAADVIQKLVSGSIPQNSWLTAKLLRHLPRTWKDCVHLARLKFEKYFAYKVS